MSDSDAQLPHTAPAAEDIPTSTAAPQAESPAQPVPAPKPASARSGLDLSSLKIMPDWVASFGKESSPSFREYEDRDQSSHRGDRRSSDRDGRGRGGPPGDRARADKPGFRRDGPPGRGAAGPGLRRPDGPRPAGGPDRGPRGQGAPFRDRRDRDSGPPREWVDLPQDIHVSVHPEDKSLDALTAHIRSTGHAFSLFDIARLVLAGGERFGVRYLCNENRPQPLFRVPADGSLFLSRDEALQHILRSSALDAFYRAEEIELEEPKGNFPSVAVCGFSGDLLGPASHHSFQTTLIRLHRERFSNMSLEDYKRRIRTESDPELVQKWKDLQRKATHWIPLTPEGDGSEPPAPLTSRHEVELHFRRLHGEQAVDEVRDITVPGNIDKKNLSPALFILLRQAVEAARKHLFEMSQKLSAGFDRRGMKTFKRRSGKMFVSRVRPRAIDPNTVFAERVTAIVERLKHAPGGMQVGDLIRSIVPDAPAPETPANPPATENAPSASVPALTDDQLAALKDVRWLVNEGYLIEYSDGLVSLGVQGETPHAPKTAPVAATPVPAEAETATPEPAATEPAPPSGVPEEGTPASDVTKPADSVTPVSTDPENPPQAIPEPPPAVPESSQSEPSSPEDHPEAV